ncbi:MAG: anaerobic sulfite reductase subunit AsrA [Oscillospiraceae bacterium]|nr:anaerobic sulfite reductase subunit AsrA [Oscillospiraceae bacterium]
MALLAEKNDIQAQKSFLENHLLNWIETFVGDIAKYVHTDFYKALGLITLGFLRGEAELLAAVESGACGCSRSYSVRNERMANILARLKEHYHVYAPMRFPKRGPKGSDLIRYGEISELTDIVYKEKSHFSAKECFYPVSQTMFFFKGDECIEKLPDDDKGIILICRACDINAIKRLDTIFLGNGEKDIYYKRMRDKLKLIMLECKEGFENCFCASMGTNKAYGYCAALRIDDICALMEICDEDLLPYFADEVPADFAPAFVSENKRSIALPEIAPEQFGEICAMNYWKQFDDKCISCGGCNTVCPTCSCFDTVDIIYDETSHDGERRRVWSSCMLRSFTETAGGGIVRDTAGANMRFKVMHKFFDFRQRFGGENMCVGCGRCVDRCPQGIDFIDVVNGLSTALSKGGESK